ncbi:MAG: metallophosphoesterase [Pseudomonadota bacterium]
MPNESMWIAFGDIHEDIQHLNALPLQGAQGIIITGDLTNCGGVVKTRSILNHIAARLFMHADITDDDPVPQQILAQIGNMDLPEVTDFLEEMGMNMHGKVMQVSDTAVIVGLGGSNKTPFNTPSEFFEADYEEFLNVAKSHIERLNVKHVLLVSHTPPVNTTCDAIAAGVHVGSTAVRDFIQDVQPDLCICGHIHEAIGTDTIGRTTIINPGSFADGGYIRVVLKEGVGFSGELCKV